MRITGLSAIALLAGSLAFSQAQAADVMLSWAPSGALDVKAQITTPNGCYFSSGAKLGGPEDLPDIENTIGVTLAVNARGDICPQEITVLDYHFTVPGIPKGTAAIIIYETWPQANMVKATAYRLPARKK